MGFHIQLYQNKSDPRALTKNLVFLGSEIAVDIIYPTDRLCPNFVLDSSKVDLTKVNYLVCPELGRYYFIDSVVGSPGKRQTICCHVDVLYTFKDQILELDVIAARSSSNYNTYLNDNLRLCNSYVSNIYRDIGDLGPCDTPVLITVGYGGILPDIPQGEQTNQEGGEE